MFKIKCWYSPGGFEKNKPEKYIRCSNDGKETIIDVDIINTKYQYKFTTYALS